MNNNYSRAFGDPRLCSLPLTTNSDGVLSVPFTSYGPERVHVGLHEAHEDLLRVSHIIG